MHHRICFFVAGLPRALSVGSTIHVGDGRAFQGRRGTPWATLVGYAGRQHAPAQPMEGPVRFVATFHLPRPQHAGKLVTWPLKRPDLDNLFHKLTDQWDGVFWINDSQIVDVRLQKCFATDRPGVEIVVEPVPST